MSPASSGASSSGDGDQAAVYKPRSTALKCGHFRPGLARGEVWCELCQDFEKCLGFSERPPSEATSNASNTEGGN